jgi:hypothetical protein
MSDAEEEKTAAAVAYDALFRNAYDTKFTTDISNKMQMPDRLGAINNYLDSFPLGSPARSVNSSDDLFGRLALSLSARAVRSKI